jgi:glutamate carboxypeptidase
MSRPDRFPRHSALACIAACTLALSALPSWAAPVERIHELAQQKRRRCSTRCAIS